MNEGKLHSLDYAALLEEVSARTMRGGSATRAEIIRLLAVSPGSREAALLVRKARGMAAALTGNHGRIWSAIGIDNRPCPMNCAFCSFGEKWGLVGESSEWSDKEVVEAARVFVEAGASWFVLRTTQFYDFARLTALAATIRAKVSGAYDLVVNTGEFGPDGAQKLLDAGVSCVYHTLRLGEGKTTCFKPEERLATLAAIRDSNLKLVYLVEPLGPEHSNEEIADRLLTAYQNRATLCGVMARVNVPGTPFERHGTVSEERKACVTAVSRVCGGRATPDICVHPPSRQALAAGANVVIVECGSIPRSNRTEHKAAWNGFGLSEAKALLTEAGYAI